MVDTKIKLITFLCSLRWRNCIQSAKIRPGANCGSDHQLLIAKSRLKLERVGKTTKSSRYDLNQIHYEYEVEVMNRFKGLDLVNSSPEELWTEVCNIVKKAVGSQDGEGIGRGDHFLFYKFIERTTER